MVLKFSFDKPKKAIVLTAGDALVDFDAPYLAVLPELFKEIFAAYLGQTIKNCPVEVPDEAIIREIACAGKGLHQILGSCLYLSANKAGSRIFETDEIIAHALDINNDQVDAVELSEPEEKEALKYIDLDGFNGNKLLALRSSKMERLVRQELQSYQDRLDSDISSYLNENGPFIPGAIDAVKALSAKGCLVKIINVYDQRGRFPCDIGKELPEKTGLPQESIASKSLRSMEGKDVKDLFPDLEYLEEENIMVFSNHVGLLSRSISLDFEAVDRLSAEFYDTNSPGGPGFSRLKDAPYHVCMLPYNKSTYAGYVPSTIRDRHVMQAQSPEQIVQYAEIFLSRSVVHSFAPSAGIKSDSSAIVLEFPKKKL